jgi:hypothetical protein
MTDRIQGRTEMIYLFGKSPMAGALIGLILIIAGLMLGKWLIVGIGVAVTAVSGLKALAGGRSRGLIGGQGDGRSRR